MYAKHVIVIFILSMLSSSLALVPEIAVAQEMVDTSYQSTVSRLRKSPGYVYPYSIRDSSLTQAYLTVEAR
ncbi:hypothetical protein EJ419_00645 [Alloscardovia theropitheci]|uniref:Uncharacterized protein n=1 Tax=Alloscardovia theropitheci TaxID=2496842 RepID=A0A4R0R1C0_9BIFI|nr:hypothetical protein [Alloscardovia theropitheci]TCD54936.1 hypothetical protein EJ419_00645 [Alloscardovia theropitheci]